MAKDPVIWLAATVRILLKRVQDLELKHERISMLDTKGYIQSEAWDKGKDNMGTMDMDNMGNKDTMSNMDFDSMGKQDNMGKGQDIVGMDMEMGTKGKVDNMDKHLDSVGSGAMSNMEFHTKGNQDNMGKGLDFMGINMEMDTKGKVDNMDKRLDSVDKDTMSIMDFDSMGKQDKTGKDSMDKQDNLGMDLGAKEQLHEESDEWFEGDSNFEEGYGIESEGDHGHEAVENFRDIDDFRYWQLIPRSEREIPLTIMGIGEVSLMETHHHVVIESLKGLRCMCHRLSDGEAATAAILIICQMWPYLSEFNTHGEGRALILEELKNQIVKFVVGQNQELPRDNLQSAWDTM